MTHGTVIVIGGAEDKVRDRLILGRFIALAMDVALRMAARRLVAWQERIA